MPKQIASPKSVQSKSKKRTRSSPGKDSNNRVAYESGDRSPHSKELGRNASFENLRKQAKSLLRGVRENDPDATAVAHRFYANGEIDSLSDAQLVIARSYGFTSWAKLKSHLNLVAECSILPNQYAAADESSSIVDRFINLACLTYCMDHASRRDQARDLYAANPSLSRESIYTAATIGDVGAVRQMLQQNPALARQRGGPHNWEPLLYAAYSRLNSTVKEHSTLAVARLLLQHGADPNAGFLWDRHYLFTALTGAFGEGEAGPVHQPEHQYCDQLARLLLEFGADPNDAQTLYNRMFTGGTRHLELLFEFGLGKQSDGVWFKRLGDRLDSPAEMLQEQMAWAAKYNQMERLRLLVEHGVDVNLPDKRFHRPPYELALLHGNTEIAQYLLSHGAIKTSLSRLDEFKAACLNANAGRARTLLAKDTTLIDQLGAERAELLNVAAEADKREAIRLMAALGFNLNERKRTAALHLAAGGGHLEMVKLLIELGADPQVRDEEFSATPLGWAEYGQRSEVVDFLRQFD